MHMVTHDDFKPMIEDGNTYLVLFDNNTKGKRKVLFKEAADRKILTNNQTLEAAKKRALDSYTNNLPKKKVVKTEAAK